MSSEKIGHWQQQVSPSSIALLLPAVLEGRGRESGISMERALKQILRLLEEMDPNSDEQQDAINASIDDTRMMLARIHR